MVLINMLVVDNTSKVLIGWEIGSVEEPGESFESFFCHRIKPKLHEHVRLVRCYVGKSKASLDMTDPSLLISEVAVVFGHFVKYIVEVNEAVMSHTMLTSQTPSESAFGLVQLSVPDKVHARTRKDELYNSVIDFMVDENLTLPSNEVSSFGKHFAQTLCNTLWYVDGCHETLAARHCPVPQIFSRFQNYNKPELSKHRKRTHLNLDSTKLMSFSSELFTLLLKECWKQPAWVMMKTHVEVFAKHLADYANYLTGQNKKMKEHHIRDVPARQLSENLSISFIPTSSWRPSYLDELNEALLLSSCFCIIELSDYLPTNARDRYNFIQKIRDGLCVPIALAIYSAGGSIGNICAVWRMPDGMSVDEQMSLCLPVIEAFKSNLVSYHTRGMKKILINKFGLVAPSIKPYQLRYFYKELTGDASAPTNVSEANVDDRIQEIIDLEDPDIIADLRALNSSAKRTKYDRFWQECDVLLNEEIGVAVDERRHTEIVHLATAISVRDLQERVKSRLPEGTAIPSLEWLRLQFWPKTKQSRTALHYTGRLKVRFMIQQRQFRKQHPDQHYAAALFRYQREYALNYRAFSTFICLDDKHKIKVGEPGLPIAAVDRGRRVIVSSTKSFEVGDHDFAKFSLTPSVILIVDIPHKISDSWYQGKVYVGIKDSVFQCSSPIRHSCELSSVLTSHYGPEIPPLLFIYTDGGPDHRLTYISVQLSLICLFLKHNLDFLCAVRTAPYHSWRNPVERVMSTLNLALHCIGLMRKEMPDSEFERIVSNCNSLAEIRKAGENNDALQKAVTDSLLPCTNLLCDLFRRVEWGGKKLDTLFPATSAEIDEFWRLLLNVDNLLETCLHTRKTIESKTDMLKFIDHCCKQRHYAFDVKKCGDETCSICSPPRLPQDVFSTLHHLPDPMLSSTNEGHYKTFDEVFGEVTDENGRPSAKPKKDKETSKRLFSIKNAKNTKVVVQCEVCCLWRLIYCPVKLTETQISQLQHALDDASFSCGSPMSDLGLDLDVHSRPLNCYEPIEKQYYSSGQEPICVYCGCLQSYTSPDHYPQCSDCNNKDPIHK